MSDNKVNLLPVKNDYVFARLFGAKSHKHVRGGALLNSILNGKPRKPHINDITPPPPKCLQTLNRHDPILQKYLCK